MTPIEFLLEVWGHSCQSGDRVFLSTKNSEGKWKDYPLTYERGIGRRLKEWFRSHPDSSQNIYYCPTPFQPGGRRRKEFVRHVNILWADIDEGRAKIEPTILVESSPGRLQGLWYLNQDLDLERGETLNKALSYYIGADKGGWDLSQVLRVPGTRNHKYSSKPVVRVIESNLEKSYEARKLERRVGHSVKSEAASESTIASPLTFEQVLSKHRRRIPPTVKRLLMQTREPAEGKRSEVLWFLEHKLNEAGLSPPEIIRLVKDSVWNKFKGRRNEDEQLRSEVQKIIEGKINVPSIDEQEDAADEELTSEFKVESYRDVLTARDSTPGWLVEHFWMQSSHGAIAGEPKSFKSTLAMDLAVSVASGKPFLGKYAVMQTGPVLYIQNENARWIMRDRLEKIASNKGLVGHVSHHRDGLSVRWPPAVPIQMINQQSFMLSDPLHLKQLEELVESMKPALIIFDPLYLMFDGDINSARELSPVLTWLLEMRNVHSCAVIVIHHWKKASSEGSQRGGQRMLGSTTLHGWIESAWYITADSDNEAEENAEGVNKAKAIAHVTLEREFRGAGIHPKIELEITMGDMGKPEYNVEVELFRPKKAKAKKAEDSQVKEEIVNLVRLHKDGLTIRDLLRDTGCDKEQLGRVVDQLLTAGTIRRNGRKIMLDNGGTRK